MNCKQQDDMDLNRLKQAVTTLYEHFDTVQIFATRCEENGEHTVNVGYGTGNWFARFGQITSWVDDCKNNYISDVAAKRQRDDDKPEWEE